MDRFRIAIVLAFVAALGSIPARAGFIGSTVDTVRLLPDVTTVNATAPSALVGAGVEVANLIGISVDVSDTAVLLTDITGLQFNNTAFDGYRLTFTGAAAITGVTLDGSSTLIPLSAVSFTSNTILINYANLPSGPIGRFSLLDVTFGPAGGPGGGAAAVPLPRAVWAGCIGCIAMLMAQRQLRRTGHSGEAV